MVVLNEGVIRAKGIHESKRNVLNASEDSPFALTWDMEGYSELLGKSERIQKSISRIVDRIDGPVNDRDNIKPM